MAKYLASGTYTLDGIRGVMKEGGTGRRRAIEALAVSMGGKLESLYWGFGHNDFYLIVDLPDNVTAAAVSMLVAATGAAQPQITVLLTAEEVDEATRRSGTYRPPGQ